jgi:predicted nucleotidyltransferase
MAEPADHIRLVAKIVQELRALGFEPVLIGGMALVVLGSRRVTRDFDFVVADPGNRLDSLVDVFYGHGLELVSRLDEGGNVTATIDSRRVASIRLRLDRPASVYFFTVRTGLRIDLLFDFPVPAADLVARATRLTIRGQSLLVASEEDLLRLKRAAAAARSVPGDADDIAFLESRKRARPDDAG